MGVLADFEEKINQYIRENPTFKNVCEKAFAKYDTTKNGSIELSEGAKAWEDIFDQVQTPLKDYGVNISKPSINTVEKYLMKYDTNKDGKLQKTEFIDFYKKLLVVAAYETTVGFLKKYGIGMAVGTGFVMGVKSIVRAIAGEDADSTLAYFPSVIIGPILGIGGTYAVDQTDCVNKAKKYLSDNGIITAAPPETPTATLLSAQTPTSTTVPTKPATTTAAAPKPSAPPAAPATTTP